MRLDERLGCYVADDQEEFDQIPKEREPRMAEIRKIPNEAKKAMIPIVGQLIRLGPHIYKVQIQNIGDIRFTARLHDVMIKDVNIQEEKSRILDPNSKRPVHDDIIKIDLEK